jgi:hypothetical protein
MSRRTSLPGAAELFRTTSAPEPEPDESQTVPPAHPGVGAVAVPREFGAARAEDTELLSTRPTGRVRSARRMRAVADRTPTGRERHDEKITVYCSPDELIDLDTARLQLRADHGLVVDRGRIVREAVAVVLADLEAKGEASILVRRLRES